MEYLVDGLVSGTPASRRASSLRLVDACSSPHARFLLRLSGCLQRLLEALVVAEQVSAEGSFIEIEYNIICPLTMFS